jgi:hypothetical protein
MTPEEEQIDAASHAPACLADVQGYPCVRHLGHYGDHVPNGSLLGEIARQAEQRYAEYVARRWGVSGG